MKKLFTILIALAVISLSYQLIVNLFISHKEINYSLKDENHSFLISEKFYKMEGKHYYDYEVKVDNKNTFFFSNVGDYNKQMKMLKKIVSYQDKNLNCYLPVMKDDSIEEINCFYKKELVDYNYLLTNGVDVSHLVSFYRNLGYSRDSWKEASTTTKKYDVNNNSVSYVYKDNIPDDYVLPIWNYNGISFVTNKGIESKQYLDKDIYDNKYSYLMGKYYFIFDLDSEVETSQDLFIVNVEDYGKNSIILPDSVSGKMYINGSFKKKLYFTDLKSKKQYTVDPVSEKVVVVGDEDTGYSIFDGDKLGTISSNEFLDSKYYFDSTIVDEIQKKYPKAEVKKDGNYYAFKTTDNIIYLVSKDDLSVVKKLFHFNHISEWNIKNGDIMVLNDDTMYLYTEGSGLKPVLKNKEFTFNHYNICNFYKKS